jgi:hypothetical protein
MVEKTNNCTMLYQNFTHFIPIIFGFLEGKEIIKCYFVCNIWKNIISHIKTLDASDKIMCKLLSNNKIEFTKIEYLDSQYIGGGYFDIKYLCKLINLKTIIIAYNNTFCDDHLQNIALMKNLENLSIMYCKQITNKALSHIGRSNIKLHSFILSSSNITDEGLIFLNKNNLKNLHTFDIQLCDNITDNGLIYILQRTTKLKKLNINFSDLITDASIDYIPDSLHILCARSCSGLNFKNAIKLTNLKELELRSCPIDNNIHDDTIKHIIPYLTNLIFLNLSECNITDDVLESISLLPNLVYLDLYFCKNITNNGLKYISNIRKQNPEQFSKQLLVRIGLNNTIIKEKEQYILL